MARNGLPLQLVRVAPNALFERTFCEDTRSRGVANRLDGCKGWLRQLSKRRFLAVTKSRLTAGRLNQLPGSRLKQSSGQFEIEVGRDQLCAAVALIEPKTARRPGELIDRTAPAAARPHGENLAHRMLGGYPDSFPSIADALAALEAEAMDNGV